MRFAFTTIVVAFFFIFVGIGHHVSAASCSFDSMPCQGGSSSSTYSNGYACKLQDNTCAFCWNGSVTHPSCTGLDGLTLNTVNCNYQCEGDGGSRFYPSGSYCTGASSGQTIICDSDGQAKTTKACTQWYDTSTGVCTCDNHETGSSGQECCGWIDPNTNICLQTKPTYTNVQKTCAQDYDPTTDTCLCSAHGGYTVDGIAHNCCGVVSGDGKTCLNPNTSQVSCGTPFDASTQACSCSGSTGGSLPGGKNCCGWQKHGLAGTCTNLPPDQQPSANIVACGSAITKSNFNANTLCSCTSPISNFVQTSLFTSIDDVTLCCGYKNVSESDQCGTVEKSTVSCGDVIASGVTTACPCTGGHTDQLSSTTVCCGWSDANAADSCSSTATQSRTVACGSTILTSEATGVACACGTQTDMLVGGVAYKCCGIATESSSGIWSCGERTTTGDTDGTDNTLTNATFDTLNKAIFGAAPDSSLTTPRGLISRALPYLFSLAGLILFVMLIWGGFEMLTGAANPKNQEAGRQRITAAVIGFILLFASYWLARLVSIIFGINILG